jgi:putative DNA primase/helicase
VTIADVARSWQGNGVSVVPIMPNGTKRPAVRWAPYQITAPTLGQVNEWWGNGQQYGLALICGAVSGGLELLELEGRATGSTSLSIIAETIRGTEVEELWAYLTGPDGYLEWTPSGGIHILYRITDHPVPGNSKIARNAGLEVLAETRGEGGYVVVAPTSGLCHPSGESWELLQGQFGRLPEITWDQRCLLHEAIRLCLDEAPPAQEVELRHPPALPTAAVGLSAGGSSPGDEFEAVTDWSDIIGPHGWVLESRGAGNLRNWTRPGKETRAGSSATTGYKNDRDRLYVFSTSTLFTANRPYTKFGAYTLLNHNGNFSAAASALARQGFGKRADLAELVVAKRELDEATPENPYYDQNDTGNAECLHDRVKDGYRWVPEVGAWMTWDGNLWSEDSEGTLCYEFMALTKEKREQAVRADDQKGMRHWVKSGDAARVAGALKLMRSIPGMTVSANKLDPNRHLVNVDNGVLNLETGQLLPHDPKYLMTKKMNVPFEETATCPNFVSFMERVLPDQAMRTYVQRALGYTLLGDADQRAMFLIYGPSGTGKSTLMDTMAQVFGDYAVTAAPGTFRATGKEHGPTNDLHMLKGRRFVSTSETNEGTLYNEDLLKRLTGRDRVTSRELYQKNQEWTPVCTLWLATNHLPRFSTDDDAIWRRLKLVPFSTVLVDEPDHQDDYGRTFLTPEGSGILNWLLQGLQDFLECGLGEPPEVREAAQGQRLQSDPVAQFLEDRLEEGVLALGVTQSIKITDLYAMYAEWARQVGERTVGSRRFNQRLQHNGKGMALVKMGQVMTWTGIGRAAGASVLGSMVTVGWGHPDPD